VEVVECVTPRLRRCPVGAGHLVATGSVSSTRKRPIAKRVLDFFMKMDDDSAKEDMNFFIVLDIMSAVEANAG
jgi:hypothetical protein